MTEAAPELLNRIAADWSSCTACRLHLVRTNVVALEDCRDDPARPVVLVVGEAPGKTEDETGRPFHPDTPAGALLRRILEQAGVLSNCVITGCIACRPTGDVDPQADEIAACRPRLAAILAATSPVATVSVGRLAKEQIAIAFPHARKKSLLAGVPTVHVVHPASWLRANQSSDLVDQRVRVAAKAVTRLVEKIDLAPRGVEGCREHRWRSVGWWTRDTKPVRPLEQCPCGQIR